MSWLSIITLLLRLVRSFVELASRRRLLDAGAREQIIRETAAIDEMVRKAEEVERQVDAASDEEVDEALEQDYRD